MFEAYVGAVYTEQGFEKTSSWLAELFKPYAHAAFDEAMAERNITVSHGALMKLNEMLQRAGLKPVKWAEKKAQGANGSIVSWQMDAVVEGRHVGMGIAQSKAGAKNIAAEEALKFLEAQPPSANSK